MSEREAGSQPWYIRVVLCLLTVSVTAEMHDRRGLVMAIVAAVTFGGLAVTSFVEPHMTQWSRRHPAVDTATVLPISFVGVVFLTPLSVTTCLAIAAGFWAVVFAVGSVTRARRRSVVVGDGRGHDG